jgi:hypothetical protein
MKIITLILLLCTLSSCYYSSVDGSKILYDGDKCVVIQVNDSTIVLAPGFNSGKNVEAKVVFLSGKNGND